MPTPVPDEETDRQDLPTDEQSEVTIPNIDAQAGELEFNRCPACVYPCEDFLPMLPRQFFDATEVSENYWQLAATDPATIKDQDFANFRSWPCGKFIREHLLTEPEDDGTTNIIPDPI